MRFRHTHSAFIMALLACTLFACTSRAPHSPAAETPSANGMEESKALELIASWRGSLNAYLQSEEGQWSTRLSQLRDVRTRHGLRPGRITFSSLAPGGDIHRADGWDVNGLLLGRPVLGGRHWYLFIIGIVEREGYRPSDIGDIRLVAFTNGGEGPDWRVGTAEPGALERYKKNYMLDTPVRFPADDDKYQIDITGYQARVRESRLGAEWTLSLNAAPTRHNRHPDGLDSVGTHTDTR